MAALDVPPASTLPKSRKRLAFALSGSMLFIYAGFILLVAYQKPLLGSLIVPGLSWGIALGVLVTKLVEFPMLRLRDHLFPRRVKSAVEDTPTEAAALTAPDLAAPLEKVIST